MKRLLSTFLIALLWATALNAQLQDSDQRTTPSINAVTPRAFHGAGAPGAVSGNLSQDSYLDTSVSPAVGYICTAMPDTATPACGSVAPGQWQVIGGSSCSQNPYCVLNYHGSGMKTTLTGGITSGTSSLVITGPETSYFAGQGIYVPGAGAVSGDNPNGDLVSSIISIVGLTITLADNASATVNNVTVRHEDHAAINSAIAAAVAGGGGLVWFPGASAGVDGVYGCFVLDPATGGCISFPQDLRYINPITIMIRGEYLGVANPTTSLFIQSGTYVDTHLAPNISAIGSGVPTAALAPAPFVAITVNNYLTSFAPVNVDIDNLGFFLPNQTRLNGLLLCNAMQAKVGDNIYVVSQPDSANTWSAPTGGTVDICMPQYLNNVVENIGTPVVVGFNAGIVPGEHVVMTRPYLAYTNVCLNFVNGQHLIGGRFACEASTTVSGSFVSRTMAASIAARNNYMGNPKAQYYFNRRFLRRK